VFRRRGDAPQEAQPPKPTQRITSVLAEGTSLRGSLTGEGGVRVEGTFDGEINLDGLFVIGPTGRVTCEQVRARTVIIAGALKGGILAERVEIRASGRVWGDVIAESMATEEGAFLRGQIQMEDAVDLGYEKPKIEESDEEGEESKEKASKPKGQLQTKK
jgi:cytoskeletal protein CcmA (bactofilin family)